MSEEKTWHEAYLGIHGPSVPCCCKDHRHGTNGILTFDDYRALESRASLGDRAVEALRASGLLINGEWHAGDCYLFAARSVGLKWCDCEQARTILSEADRLKETA